MVDGMDFRHLLSGLGHKYQQLEEQTCLLRKEKSRLSEELAQLRKALTSDSSAIGTGLPGSVPDFQSPTAATRDSTPRASPPETPPGISNVMRAWESATAKDSIQGDETGRLTIRGVTATNLLSSDLSKATPGVFFVSAQVQKGQPRFSPHKQGPDANWDGFQAEFLVGARESVLHVQVHESRGAGVLTKSLGGASLQFRSLPPGSWQRRTEVVSAIRGVLEFEVCWSPGQLQPRAEPFAVAPWASKSLKDHGGESDVGRETWLDEHIRARQNKRFRMIFGAEGDSRFRVTARALMPVLDRRGLPGVSEHWLESALLEISRVAQDGSRQVTPRQAEAPRCMRDGTSMTSLVPLPGSPVPSASAELSAPRTEGAADGCAVCLSLEAFVDAIHMSDLAHRVDPSQARRIMRVQEVLLKEDVDEVIRRLTRKKDAYQPNDQLTRCRSIKTHCGYTIHEDTIKHIDTSLGIVVTTAVLTSVLCLALSQDYMHDSVLWPALEVICAIIFVAEISIKIAIHGNSNFWCGEDRYWNWFDFSVTVISVVDVLLSTVAEILSGGFRIGRLALAMRVFRMLRLARLLKVMKSPFVRELSNMLVGFLLGCPALFWVMIIIWFVVGLIATIFRIVVGPEPGEELLLERCGSGDAPLITQEEEPACEVHRLYAEEYCGTVAKCMFTVFRCMIGDCSSKGGQSLSEHLSAGYGLRFDFSYLMGMVVLIFGLFNVITAIFVEATMAGLKYNETKQRYRSLYEATHVKKKLLELIARITYLRKDTGITHCESTGSWQTDSASRFCTTSNDISLTEEEFNEVMTDEQVKSILEQVDVDVTHKEALFEVMDPNNTGEVSLASMIDALFKLRGGLMKVDMIAPWVAIRSLRQEFRDLTLSIASNTRKDEATGRDDIPRQLA